MEEASSAVFDNGIASGDEIPNGESLVTSVDSNINNDGQVGSLPVRVDKMNEDGTLSQPVTDSIPTFSNDLTCEYIESSLYNHASDKIEHLDEDFGDFTTSTRIVQEELYQRKEDDNSPKNEESCELEGSVQGATDATSSEITPGDNSQVVQTLGQVDDQAEPADSIAVAITAMSDIMISTDNKMVAYDDDVGEYEPAESISSTLVNQEIQVDDDDFGDFDAAEPIKEPHVDDDDFGDFGAAEPSSTTANVETLVDDDDFGDFDEAPISVSMERTDSTSRSETYIDYAPSNMENKGSLNGDPVLERLYSEFPKLFTRFIKEESLLIHDRVDMPIPLFTESDFVSIESCMTLSETENFARTNVQLKSYTPAHMLSALFESKRQDGKASTSSRYIVPKNATLSPLRYPIAGSILGSNRIRRKIPRVSMAAESERGVLDLVSNLSGERIASVAEPTLSNGLPLQNDKQPSDQAKAFLERIPDLSYMLSSELLVPVELSIRK